MNHTLWPACYEVLTQRLRFFYAAFPYTIKNMKNL